MNRSALLVAAAFACTGCNALVWNFGSPDGDASVPITEEASLGLPPVPDGSGVDIDNADTDGGPAWALCVNGGCATSGLHCKMSVGQCVPCLQSGNCTDKTLTVCDLQSGDPLENLCVECVHDTDCISGDVCVTNQCVQSCTDIHDCKGSPAACSKSLCLGCQSASDCVTPKGEVCNTVTGRCGACAADSDCPSFKPRCDPRTNSCASCLSSQDCKGGAICDPQALSCTGGKMWDQ